MFCSRVYDNTELCSKTYGRCKGQYLASGSIPDSSNSGIGIDIHSVCKLRKKNNNRNKILDKKSDVGRLPSSAKLLKQLRVTTTIYLHIYRISFSVKLVDRLSSRLIEFIASH